MYGTHFAASCYQFDEIVLCSNCYPVLNFRLLVSQSFCLPPLLANDDMDGPHSEERSQIGSR